MLRNHPSLPPEVVWANPNLVEASRSFRVVASRGPEHLDDKILAARTPQDQYYCASYQRGECEAQRVRSTLNGSVAECIHGVHRCAVLLARKGGCPCDGPHPAAYCKRTLAATDFDVTRASVDLALLSYAAPTRRSRPPRTRTLPQRAPLVKKPAPLSLSRTLMPLLIPI